MADEEDPFAADAGAEVQEEDPFGAPADESAADAEISGGGEDEDPFGAAEPANDDAGGFQPMQDEDPMAMPEPVDNGIPEVNKLTEWEAEWEQELMAKNAEQEQTASANREQAAKDLEQFNAEKDTAREANQSKNRNEEQVLLEQLEADLDSDNPWERVVNLVDIEARDNDDKSDVSRMRQLFIQLKTEPLEESRAKSAA
jgi:hypothetical protein